MVKSLKFLVALIAVAVFSIAGLSQSSWAATNTVGSFQLQTTDNKSCEANVVYVARQLVNPNSGYPVASQGIYDSQGSTGIIPKLNAITGGNGHEVDLTFQLVNGTFAKSNLKLVIDNSSSAKSLSQAVTNSGTVVTFKLDYTALSGMGTVTQIRLVDGDAADNATLSVNIDPAMAQQSGGVVGVRLTSTDNGKTFVSGCFNLPLYIVEDQWVAKLCKCQTCDTSGVDTDTLVKATTPNTGITVKDTELPFVGASFYNSCLDNKGEGGGSQCCDNITATCGLFCNETTEGSTSTISTCSMPGTCYKDCGDYEGLKIFENTDFELGSKLYYKINSLEDATVTFTLTATNLSNIESIELTRAPQKSGSTPILPSDYVTLTGFTMVDNTTATATIAGSTLFRAVNGGTQGVVTGSHTPPIYFSVKITPKANVMLAPNSFSLSGEISGGLLATPQPLSWGNFLKWAYANSGLTTFKVPYIRQDSLVTSVIRMENAGTLPVYVDLYVNDPAGTSWTYVKTVEVAAGSSVAVGGSDLINYATAAGITLDGSKGFAVKGVASSGQDTFTIYGSQQMVGGSFRPLPIKVHNTISCGNEFYSQ